MRALCVNLATAVEVTPVYPPPGVRGRVPAEESSLFRGLRHRRASYSHATAAGGPDFDGQVQPGVRRHPAVDGGARAHGGLRRGRRRADDGGAKRSRANQRRPQRVGGKAVRGGELLETVRSLAAGVRVDAVAVQDLAVLIVLVVGRRQGQVWVGLGLVPAGQDQLAPEVLLAAELQLGRGDVRLAL